MYIFQIQLLLSHIHNNDKNATIKMKTYPKLHCISFIYKIFVDQRLDVL